MARGTHAVGRRAQVHKDECWAIALRDAWFKEEFGLFSKLFRRGAMSAKTLNRSLTNVAT